MGEAEQFVEELVTAVPGLQVTLDEHLADFNELLPHVYFGEITRWIQRQVDEDVNLDEVGRVLSFLEQGYADDGDQVRELITVSFLENLDQGSPVFCLLGRQLQDVALSLRK